MLMFMFNFLCQSHIYDYTHAPAHGRFLTHTRTYRFNLVRVAVPPDSVVTSRTALTVRLGDK